VPGTGTAAFITSSGATISLGPAAVADTLFVEGPIGGESLLSSGTLSLTSRAGSQLFINVDAPGTILRLYDAGSSPVLVTASKVTLGADVGKQGNMILDSQSGGSVTLSVTDTLTIGYDGSGSYVYTYPFIGNPSGATSISAGTIEMSVLSTAGQTDYNYVGTYTAGSTLTATTMNIGVAGSQGGADNYGGTWTVGTTAIGFAASAANNYLTITDGGVYTNSAAFTVGVSGTGNQVYVGYAPDAFASTVGMLSLTGTASDLVIGAASTADANGVTVDFAGSTLAVVTNVIVGIDGHSNTFVVDHGAAATSGGARLGVNAGASGNSATVQNAATWTMNGTVRVGDKGSGNSFSILSGGVVTLTGSGKNFFVGYSKSASNNTLTVSGSGSVLDVKASDADLVVSANLGLGANATGNVVNVSDGGLLDVNRLLVGSGGSLTGHGGTVNGFTGVAAGGQIAPGAAGPGSIGTLSFVGDVDLASQGGTYAVDLGPAGAADLIIVSGSLSIADATLTISAAPVGSTGFVYEIAKYGALSGEFGSIVGLGYGWSIDYNYLSTNTIALIAPVPEIEPGSAGSVLAALAGALGLFERRLRRRPSAG